MKACHNAIRGRVGDAFSDAEIDDALERLSKRYRRKKGLSEGQDIPADEQAILSEVVDDLTGEALDASLIEKRVRLASAIAKQRREAHLAALSDLPEDERLSALNVGSEKDGARRGLSVDARRRALYRVWSSRLIRDLEAAGTLSRLANPLKRRDKDFETDVARELSRLNGGDVSKTGNVEALETARILKKYQDASVDAQNAQGAWIGRLPGYVTRQSHDAIKISGGFFKGANFKGNSARRAKAKAEWVNYIRARLDPVSFEGVDDIDAYLGRIWTDVVTGHHNPSASAHDDLDAFKPTGLLARKVSASRVLHFKDVDSWIDYNDRFGHGGIFEGFVSQLDRAASNTALMQVYGPNPRAAFDNLRDDLKASARERGDTRTVQKIAKGRREHEFDELDGTSMASENVRLAAIGRGLRLQQGFSKLGGMTLSSITDGSLTAHTLRRAGVPLLDGYKGVFGGITNLQGKAAREAADITGVGVNQIMGDIVSRYSATDGAYGVLGKLQAAFYKINLFSAWGGGVRRGVGATLSAHLGGKASLKFTSLDSDTAGMLSRYGLDGESWDVVRKGAQKIKGDPDNRWWLTPEAVDYVSDSQLKAWGQENGFGSVEAARDELRLRLTSYFTDIAETAMTEPRARENALLTFGTKPGTVVGEAVRFVMQFKSFPYTVATRHLGQSFDGIKPTAATAHIVVAGTVLGFMALQLKQLARGLTPHPLTNDEGNPNMTLLVRSLVQGGGLGIYGDFILSDYNRFGNSPIETLAGPAVGEFSNAMRLFGALRDGDDVGAKAMRQAIGNIPFNNLFYTRAAMDYLIFYQMQEWANPGSLERYERRLQEDRGQTFLLPPSETVN